jgi:hypothetical protein
MGGFHRTAGIVPRDRVLAQEAIGPLHLADPSHPQRLDEPILMRATGAFDPALGLRAQMTAIPSSGMARVNWVSGARSGSCSSMVAWRLTREIESLST